jgi:hypothetical protein
LLCWCLSFANSLDDDFRVRSSLELVEELLKERPLPDSLSSGTERTEVDPPFPRPRKLLGTRDESEDPNLRAGGCNCGPIGVGLGGGVG